MKGISLRLGRPSRFKQPTDPNSTTAKIKYLIIKWTIVILILYFFGGTILRFIFGLL